MEQGNDEVLSCRPCTGATADATEAVKPSPDSTEWSSWRRGSKRRVKTAVTSADPGSRVVRVLRARGAAAGIISESVNATCRNKTIVMHRGRPATSRCKNTAATQSEIKKSSARKASKHTIAPKLSKSQKSKGRPATRASRIAQAPECKSEAAVEASPCGGEMGGLKESNENVADEKASLAQDTPVTDVPNVLICGPEKKIGKSRCHRTGQQKEVKKEESEKEEEEEKNNSAKVVVQSQDGVSENAELPRKRSRKQKDDKTPKLPKRRKKPPVQYVRCEMEGCGTVLAHPRYLQHHIKYQHLLKKKYVCDHPSCGRLFRLQKQLLRHAKHHTDQRDYICEYCARAFKSSHNLAVHRMIHTGEKPIQCEICGFTCRQKASLNWHMKKHDAEASYQFSCSICGKKFEKKDSVVAHKAKSHPEVLIAEALAANGGSAMIHKTVPVLTQAEQPSVGQEAVSATLSPIQQVVLPLLPQIEMSQAPFLQLPTHQVLQQQHAPTLLHLTSASPAHTPNSSHPHLTQVSTIPTNAVTSMPTTGHQSTLLTLTSVTTLAPAVSLAPQQGVEWDKEAHEDRRLSVEGELWNRVAVGGDGLHVEGVMWKGNRERREEDEGTVWETEGDRHILLQCEEIPRGDLI